MQPTPFWIKSFLSAKKGKCNSFIRKRANTLTARSSAPYCIPVGGNDNKEEKMKTKKKFTTSQLTVLGLMSGVLLLMAYTPLGYLNIGPLAISFNVIPVAVSAVVLGPAGGAVAGAIFGLTSFGQCIGIGGTSAMGAVLFGISPVLAFLQRFLPRLLTGICIGYIFRAVRKKSKYLCVLRSNRLLLSVFKHCIFYDSACGTVRKYRIYQRADRRAERTFVLLCFCGY